MNDRYAEACHRFAESHGWKIIYEEQEAGNFKGGYAAYGYDLVKSGRMNKRKHELLSLRVNEAEADIVRRIYGKYVNEGYGAQRIATWLNNQG